MIDILNNIIIFSLEKKCISTMIYTIIKLLKIIYKLWRDIFE